MGVAGAVRDGAAISASGATAGSSSKSETSLQEGKARTPAELEAAGEQEAVRADEAPGHLERLHEGRQVLGCDLEPGRVECGAVPSERPARHAGLALGGGCGREACRAPTRLVRHRLPHVILAVLPGGEADVFHRAPPPALLPGDLLATPFSDVFPVLERVQQIPMAGSYAPVSASGSLRICPSAVAGPGVSLPRYRPRPEPAVPRPPGPPHGPRSTRPGRLPQPPRSP